MAIDLEIPETQNAETLRHKDGVTLDVSRMIATLIVLPAIRFDAC